MAITRGKQSKPQKVVIYGPEGIGKTTLAAQFPAPIFFDIEGGTSHFDVDRIANIVSYDQFQQELLQSVMATTDYKTIVVDTVDWMENLIIDKVCRDAGKAGVEDFGYGKGYTYVAELFQKWLGILDSMIESGYNIVLLAHAQMRKFELPEEGGSYDRWELKLSKKTCPIVKEWADMLLFCNYKTYLVTGSDGKQRAQGGKRVMYTSHNPCWDAKNRHGLADELPLEYASIAACIPAEKIDPLQAVAQTVKAENLDKTAETSKKVTKASTETQKKTKKATDKPKKPVIPTNIKKLIDEAGYQDGWVLDVIYDKGWYPMGTAWSEMAPEFFSFVESNWAGIKALIEAIPVEQRLPF